MFRGVLRGGNVERFLRRRDGFFVVHMYPDIWDSRLPFGFGERRKQGAGGRVEGESTGAINQDFAGKNGLCL